MGGENTPGISTEELETMRTISTGRWWQTWMIRPERGKPLAR